MRSPAAAFAWEFRRRHRWGLMAVGCYLVALVTFRLLIFEAGWTGFESDESFAFAVVVPLAATYMYFLAIFSFGLRGDLAGRGSIFPARMFALPVTTRALAGWPMLFGTASVLAVWLVTRPLAVHGFGEHQLNNLGWPPGTGVPILWPAVLGAAILAWTQALTWMPYALPGMRVVVTVLLMTMIDVVAILAVTLEASEPTLLLILTPLIPLAYLVACFALSRARRGDVPDWGKLFARFGAIADSFSRRHGEFRSATAAQVWFEWRRHGRSLPMLVAILLPFELSMIFLFRETPAIVFETLVAVLLTPPFMAAFVASTIGRSNTEDTWGLPPFIAARPLGSASLIGATLRVTVRSTLTTWLMVIAGTSLAVVWSGVSDTVIDWGRELVETMGAPRALVLVLLVLGGLVASTWKQLVQSLYVSLSGREWAVKGSAFAALALLTIGVPLVQWMVNSGRLLPFVWKTVPWIAAVLAGIKVVAAAWIAIRLRSGGLVSDRALVTGAATWTVAVLALHGLLVWLVSTPLFPTFLLALVAILEVPLARVSAAPLALEWNRHR